MATLPSFSLKWLFVAVAFVALCVAGLTVQSPLWPGLFRTLNIVLFLASIVGVVYARGPDRAFAGGFAICNGTMLVLLLGPWFSAHIGDYLLAKVIWLTTVPGSGLGTVYSAINVQRAQVGNLTTALLAGYMGGLLARHLYLRRPE